jgi:hypothetical protein
MTHDLHKVRAADGDKVIGLLSSSDVFDHVV